MTSSNQRRSDTGGNQESQDSLQLVDGITSTHLRFSIFLITLLPGAIVFLSFPLLLARLGSFQRLDATLLVRGLLGMIWVVSGVALNQQSRRLKALRKGLIGQMDRATKSLVRAEQFYGMSIIDPLTRLYNRRFGETRLEEEVKRADGLSDPLMVVAIDFDKFKEINDTYGHAGGDLALKEFSRRLQRAIRACDVAIRVGGDEFLLILPECPPDKVQLIFSRMGSITFTVDGRQVSVSFSHGMAQYQVNDTPETLIKRADERLYAEKAKRRNDTDQTNTRQPQAYTKASESHADEPLSSSRVAQTPSARVRRSSRTPNQMAIHLIGTDLGGKVFTERTNTIELSQQGATIVSQHKISPEQAMIIRCLDTNKEAEARVVRAIGSKSDCHTYGVEFESPATNIWGLEFPPSAESEKEASRRLFECGNCKGRETIDDSGVESGGCAVNESVVRFCKRCGSVTTYQRVLGDDSGTTATENPRIPADTVAVP